MSSARGPPPVAAPALRQFAFFDVVPVKDVHDPASAPELLKNPGDISCLASSSAGLLLADISGAVHLLNKVFEAEQSWIAHGNGRVMHMVTRKGVLVTIGEEEGVRHPLLKIWDLQKFDKKTGNPTLLRSVKVQHNNKHHPVSTIALSANLSHLALGLADGTVLLYRHLDQALSSGAVGSLPKPRTLHESPTEPITGLGFREPDEHITQLHLFVVTTNHVLAYQASGRGATASGHVVDEVGAPLGCAVMDAAAKEIILARDDAVYMCSTEGRGNCLVLEGYKTSVHMHGGHLAAVFPPVAPSLGAASKTVRHFAAGARSGGLPAEVTKVSVLDPANKLVAFSGTFTDGVREMFSSGGNLHVLSNSGQLSCIAEKPMSEKLEILYSQGQYTLALAVARTQHLDAERVADVHRHYGDFLYARGEHDGAMAQYVQTIGSVQPSYVIRKFLDAQRIHNLVTYLQELHALGLANADHTTLLLNTYTKLKDVTRLEAFIRTESRRGDGIEGSELPFDLDTAIRVCRQAGFPAQAAYLARRYARHTDLLRILIDDQRDYAAALAYLRTLPTEAVETELVRYGRALLDAIPEQTTHLMVDVCVLTGPLNGNSVSEDKAETATSPSKQGGGASYLSFMALNRGSTNEKEQPPPSPTATTVTAKPDLRRQGSIITGDEPRTSAVRSGSGSTTPSQQSMAAPSIPSALITATSKPPITRRPSPKGLFPHFVNHLDRFMGFLEDVAARRWGQTLDGAANIPPNFIAEPVADEVADHTDQVAVWNTLLELYLTLPLSRTGKDETESDDTESAPLRAKALRLLQSGALPYDPTHALILCSTRAFTPGLVLLWERRGMHEDVLRFWMDRYTADPTSDASTEVVRYLRAYGAARPALYPLVLRFLTSARALLSKHRADVEAVLEHIEAEKIMSPVAVVQVLSRNDVASVGLVKQWLMTRLKEAREEIKTDEQLTASYRSETEAKTKQAMELRDPDTPRMFHSSRCTMCRESLTLPAVHFMCGHSYHQQRCLQDRETECPTCAQAHGVIRELRANNARLADQHDVFLADVRENGFNAVAGAFGRGVLNASGKMEDVLV